ncbi:MAG: SOS response-associated peptidase [Proteobacteria bacterium]|nr:SOS response-associated peptidase [Pseudomonadota bacterium]
MCARYTMLATAQAIADVFGVTTPGDLHPHYNLAPTDSVPGIVLDKDGQRLLWTFRWGLIPFWAKNKRAGVRMINARSETVATKSAFRDPFRNARMLVLADGFYEWRVEDGVKQPYHIRRIDRQPFAMAGLYAKWRSKEDDTTTVSNTILTTRPNALAGQIHDRMPVILPAEHHELWLSRDVTDPEVLKPLLEPIAPTGWEAMPVHRRVGNVRHEEPDCLEEVGEPLRVDESS